MLKELCTVCTEFLEAGYLAGAAATGRELAACQTCAASRSLEPDQHHWCTQHIDVCWVFRHEPRKACAGTGMEYFRPGKKKQNRCFNIISLLRTVFVKKQTEQTEHDLVEATLTATQSLITYRYTYMDHLRLPLMLELMMLDMNYPKSLAYLVNKIKRYVELLQKTGRTKHCLNRKDWCWKRIHYWSWLMAARWHRPMPLPVNTGHCSSFLINYTGWSLKAVPWCQKKTYFRHSVSQKQLYISNLILGVAIMLYSITHTTLYKYNEAVDLCHNIAILYPRDTATQQCRSFKITITRCRKWLMNMKIFWQ